MDGEKYKDAYEREMEKLIGKDAAKAIGKRNWLSSMLDIHGRECEYTPAASNEILGGDILCLLGLDLQRGMKICFDPVDNRCTRIMQYGKMKGQKVEIPVCQCAGRWPRR